jgi:hypothetical protein
MARASLEGGVIARVEGQPVLTESIRRISSAQAVAPEVALDRALFDAILAEEQKRRPPVLGQRRAERAVLARMLVEQEVVAARARGPVTSAEVAPLVAAAWFDVDRPEGAKVVHALARVPDNAPPERWSDAEAVGRALRDALSAVQADASKLAAPELWTSARPTPDPASDLVRRSLASFETRGLELVIEELDPVAADGKTVSPTGRTDFDKAFVEHVMPLRVRGDLTPPFRSSFGVHVAMLLQRTPARVLSSEDRLSLFENEVIAARVRAELAAVVQASPPEAIAYETNADALLETITVSR